MIDVHSHILPGIDDGSKDAGMSAAMLAQLKAQGVDAVVATPHFYAASDNPEAFLKRRTEAFRRLGDTEMTVLPGAEVAYFDGMSRTDRLNDMCLGSTRLLLVEMPYGKWSERMVREVCSLPVQQGLQPVLAHVDRYREQFMKYLPQLAEHEVLFQCNAEAFLSWRTRGWALGLLRRGQLHFLGSDCHNLTTRAPRMDAAAAVITKKLGMDILEELTQFSAEMLNII